jgi:hypothetical protein
LSLREPGDDVKSLAAGGWGRFTSTGKTLVDHSHRSAVGLGQDGALVRRYDTSAKPLLEPIAKGLVVGVIGTSPGQSGGRLCGQSANLAMTVSVPNTR